MGKYSRIADWVIVLDNDITPYNGTIATTLTAADGTYSFDDLAPGTYVVYEGMINGWMQVYGESSYNIVVGANGLISSGSATGNDFGNIECEPDALIGGHKFFDHNGNGVADPGDQGLAGWSIMVDGHVIDTTDANGQWSFLVSDGEHTIEEVNQSGWIQTGVVTYNITVHHGVVTGEVPTGGVNAFDFLNFQGPSVTGTKFLDANDNGIADDTTTIPSWLIVLDADINPYNGALATTLTDANGNYSFDNLTPGTYFIYENIVNGWMQVYGEASYTIIVGENGVITSGSATGNDFGNVECIEHALVGGHKFEDNNGNGSLDQGEQGLAGWGILINGHVIDTTDVNGVWSASLPNGIHTITEMNQNGWTQTGIVSYTITVLNGVITGSVPSGGTDDFDFLNFHNVSITGIKFLDANENDLADDTETLPDWTIVLDNDSDPDNGNIATTTTGADGSYSFNNLAPGTYVVYEVLQDGWSQVYGQAAYTIVVGANGVLSGGTSSGNIFGNREETGNPDVDLAIAGHKFNDLNGNGEADPGEPGLAGWVITVNGVPVATTDADGNWSTIIHEGSHTITEANQVGWTQTGVLVYNVNVTEEEVTGLPAGGLTAFDFLNFQNAMITGTKFYDANNNGIADDTVTLAGWTINLDTDSDPNNGTIATTLTAADGTYSFTNLAPGTYVVYETMQSGWTQAYGLATYTITVGANGIASGGTSTGNNFGNIQQIGIGGHKFEDHNGNGTVDLGDQGLAGWTILVDGTAVDTTDVDGVWSVVLTDGTHTITEVNQTGWTQTGAASYTVTVTQGQVTGNVPSGGTSAFDFLNFENAIITGTKFYDANGNGLADDTVTLAGWTINLDTDSDPNNGITATTITAADGTYSFANLAPGTYVVYETMQNNWTQAYGQAAYTIIVGASGVASGETSSGNNFGNVRKAEIGGHKFEDHNGNGTVDQGDQGLAGWSILVNGNAADITDADGVWSVILADGTHTITEVNQTGWTQTGAVTYTVTVTQGVVTSTEPSGGTNAYDFLNFENAIITGTKFYDANNNGIADDTVTLAGWTINLDTDSDPNNGTTATTVTAADGTYSFANLAPGTYVVYETMQNNWSQAYGLAAYTIVVGANGIGSGETSEDNDFGNITQVEIGGHKFEDNNGNGAADLGDLGLAGWSILVDGNAADITDANGVWSVVLTDGTHTITEVNQTGWTQTGAVSYTVTVTQGVVTSTAPSGGTNAYDFLNFENAIITGTKFYDANNNGIADDTVTLAGWTINLDTDSDPNNGTTATTVTAADGTYSFANLAPGTYVVYETMQNNWSQAYGLAAYTIIVGANGIASGETSEDNDFGNITQVEIGGHKFEDNNGNGTADLGDLGLAGWSILVDGNAADITDANGVWSVVLTDGTYTITEVNQTGWTQTGAVSYTVTVAQGVVTSTAPSGGSNAYDFLNFENATITGTKFYDSNGNAIADDEMIVSDWTIYLDNDADPNNGTTATTQTDDEGNYSFAGIAPGTYYVYEVTQAGWIQTYGEDPYTVTVGGAGVQSGESASEIDFGNLRLMLCPDEHTIGFWSNNNGKNTMNDGGTSEPELQLLRDLDLAKADGAAFDPTTYAEFKTWLLGASATNMANMLSAQLAATELSVEAGFIDEMMVVDTGTLLEAFAGQITGLTMITDTDNVTHGLISIGDLMNAANAQLAIDSSTLAGDTNRPIQEALKTALDKVNNGLLLMVA